MGIWILNHHIAFAIGAKIWIVALKVEFDLIIEYFNYVYQAYCSYV
jgi:hypothetical protein